MSSLITAFATDDGIHFINRHFGDSNYYYIYKISLNDVIFVKKITNSTDEEKMHADHNKAKGISQILQEKQVNVAVSKVFGPNIKRIKKKFVCIITNSPNIKQSILLIQKNFSLIKNEWSKTESRDLLKL